VKFIAAYRDDYGVEPICAVRTESGCPIAPSTFYAAQTATPSNQACRDAELIAVIEAERRHRFVARLGARKMWLHLRRRGHEVTHCTMEQLMAQMGIQGVVCGKKPGTTIPDLGADRPTDLAPQHGFFRGEVGLEILMRS
jgi:putative transposase